MASRKQLLAAALAAVAVASPAPQQLDFGAIAAAPTVQTGPSAYNGDVDPADQTASLFTSFVAPSVATASATPRANKARGLAARDVISSSLIDTSLNGGFGKLGQTTTVNSGVTYWINGGSTHNFLGNIDNSGRIFVSQTQFLKQFPLAGGQTSDWVGHDANNGNLNNRKGGLIQLNDIGSASAPTYDWYLQSIQNDGTIQWCGRGDTGGSTYQMYSDNDATNNGLISYEQTLNNLGASFVWRNTVIGATAKSNLYNNGAFRLINTVYHNVQNVYGTGCWQIGKGGVLYLEDGTGVFQNPTSGPSFPGQTISFQDPSAVLHMDTAVYSRNSNFGPRVYGFAQGNAIEFYEIIKSFNYDASAGSLTVQFTSNNKVVVKLGSGYDGTKFRQARNPQKYNVAGYNAIFYDGVAPSQATPSQCGITAPICSDLSGGLPGGNAPSSSSSSVPATSSSTVSSSTGASTTSSSATLTSTSASTTARISTTSSSVIATSSSSSTVVSSSSKPATPTAPPTTTDGPYTPYYPALATSYTTDPALTGTTTAGQACPTTPEAGTYCGFINPEDPCAPQPDGYGPVPSPDTPSAFLAYSSLHAVAQAAPTQVPSNDGTVYTQVFKDLNAATSANSYLGLVTLKSYDTARCARECDNNKLCTSFNIFAERDPSLNPSTSDNHDPTVWGNVCPNPPSMTSFKCTLWGSSIDSTSATNKGEYRIDFQVVITGSNGYDRTNVATPPNPSGPISSNAPASSSITSSAALFTKVVASTTTSAASASTSTSNIGTRNPWKNPTNCGRKAINAPQYWLGSRFFPGPFNPQVCSDFALAQNAVNTRAGKAKCSMFNAYYLHKNNIPHGTYCTLYNSVLGSSYASYAGGKSGGDDYQCKQSWTWELAL